MKDSDEVYEEWQTEEGLGGKDKDIWVVSRTGSRPRDIYKRPLLLILPLLPLYLLTGHRFPKSERSTFVRSHTCDDFSCEFLPTLPL